MIKISSNNRNNESFKSQRISRRVSGRLTWQIISDSGFGRGAVRIKKYHSATSSVHKAIVLACLYLIDMRCMTLRMSGMCKEFQL